MGEGNVFVNNKDIGNNLWRFEEYNPTDFDGKLF